MEDDFVGAIKIKDGLFIGDEYAAQDFEFVVTNKVTHIINCAGKQIPNYWESVGVVYLTYDWVDSETQIVFDSKGEVVNEIYNFIEEAAKLGEGVLVHSVKGQSRSCCVLTAYFMKRYRWSLYKTLEFLTSRRSDLEIRTSFYHQLLNLESRLFQQTDGNVTVNWFEIGPDNDREELLLRNTFLNARSAPFDEALVNPQLEGMDGRPRKLNWVDEKSATKGNLASYLGKEPAPAKSVKPPVTSVKSILKGSNKVFKLKSKTPENEIPMTSTSKGDTSPALRMNKSVRNFSEGRNSESLVDGEKVTVATESQAEAAKNKGPNMARSSSATYLDKEDNTRAGVTGKATTASTDKVPNAKLSSINGNIIHLTINNYIAPENKTTVAQNNNFAATATAAETDQKAKQNTAVKSQQDSRPSSQKYSLSGDQKEEGLDKSPYTSSNERNTQSTEKGSLSTNYLKSAIEKKLSKEYKSQLSSTLIKNDIQTGASKTPNGSDSKGVKVFKEYTKPSDIKVNYQVLLKNRETPPPRKREEAKKALESPQRKATSKSSISTKGSGDSNMPYSSYLNNLFSTSFSQLNTVTPSAYATNIEKKTPISAKATPMTYNLTLSQKAQVLTRPQRATTSQGGEKQSSSLLASNLTKSKLLCPNEPSSATMTGAKYNNYMTQSKTNPVRVTYEKVERPHSATPDRAATPQAGLKRLGTPMSGYDTKPSERGTSPATKNNSKHTKKDSGSTQDLLAKYRQRSSSPSPMGYNPALSTSSLSLKSKAKY